MDKLALMKTFLAVAEEGAFVRASDKLGISTQLVSKYVSALEDMLRVRLFHRTTRKVSLTEEGELYFQRCQQVLEDIDDMETALQSKQTNISGELTIAAPVSFSIKHLPKLLFDFQVEYPDIKVTLKVSDVKVDLQDEGVDLAVRIGSLESSTLIAKKIAPVKLAIFASDEYLQRKGCPQHPSELHAHDYLQYSYSEREMLFSQFDVDVQSFDFTPKLIANNGDVLVNAAIVGSGIAIQPTFIAGEALASGKLTQILKGYEPKPLGIYLVYMNRQFLPAKIRCFIDFCSHYYGETPYWDVGI